MPFTVHEEAFRKQTEINITRPQEVVPDVLPENFMNTLNRGLSVKSIPHCEFPCVVYLHPNEPFRIIEHRNADMELVHTERVPTEHLSRQVACEKHLQKLEPGPCEACNAELEKALADGWVKQPYIPEAPPDPLAKLYAKSNKAGAPKDGKTGKR
jgi:hypothetical protein